MILSQIERTHIRCDGCLSAYVHIDGPLEPGLRDAGWRTEETMHMCPRCVRRQRRGLT